MRASKINKLLIMLEQGMLGTIRGYCLIMHFGQVRLSSVNEKGKTLNLKRYLLPTHHGAFPKYRKAFLAEFAYRFNRGYWPNQTFDSFCMLIFAQILHLTCVKCIIRSYGSFEYLHHTRPVGAG